MIKYNEKELVVIESFDNINLCITDINLGIDLQLWKWRAKKITHTLKIIDNETAIYNRLRRGDHSEEEQEDGWAVLPQLPKPLPGQHGVHLADQGMHFLDVRSKSFAHL